MRRALLATLALLIHRASAMPLTEARPTVRYIPPTPELLLTPLLHDMRTPSPQGEEDQQQQLAPSPEATAAKPVNSKTTILIIALIVAIIAYFLCLPDRLCMRNARRFLTPSFNSRRPSQPSAPARHAASAPADQPQGELHPLRRIQPNSLPDPTPGDDGLCCVCLDSLHAPAASLVAFPCNHVLHEHCALSWRARSPLCPVCRNPAVSWARSVPLRFALPASGIAFFKWPIHYRDAFCPYYAVPARGFASPLRRDKTAASRMLSKSLGCRNNFFYYSCAHRQLSCTTCRFHYPALRPTHFCCSQPLCAQLWQTMPVVIPENSRYGATTTGACNGVHFRIRVMRAKRPTGRLHLQHASRDTRFSSRWLAHSMFHASQVRTPCWISYNWNQYWVSHFHGFLTFEFTHRFDALACGLEDVL